MGNTTYTDIDITSQYTLLNTTPLGTLLQHKQTSMNYILKEYTYALDAHYQRERTRLEKEINCPSCENILDVHKIKTHTISGLCSTTHKIYVIFEYPQVTLADQIAARKNQNKYFEENELWSILQSINLALSYLKSTISVNTRNIFITPEGTVKALHNDMISEQCRYTVDQNYLYAPEKVTNFNRMDSELAIAKQAVFSMGMTILQAALLEEQLYCYDFTKMAFFENLLMEYLETITSRYSSDFVEMLEIMVNVNPNSRPTINDVQKLLDNFWSNTSQIVQKETNDANPMFSDTKACKQDNGIIKNLVTIASNQKQSIKFDIQPITQSVYPNLSASKQSNTIKSLQLGKQVLKLKESQSKPITQQNPLQDQENIYTDPKLLQMIRSDLQKINKLRQSSMKQTMKETVKQCTQYPVGEDIFSSIQDIKMPQKNKNTTVSKSHSNTKQIYNKLQSSVPLQESVQNIPKNTKHTQKQTSLQSQQERNIDTHNKTQARKNNSTKSSIPTVLVYCQEIDNNGHLYTGYKLNGQKHGKGKLMFDDGAYYQGQFLNNQMNGHGVLYYLQNKPAYEGNWLNDQFHGPGILYNQSPQPLEGQFNFKNFDEIEDHWTKYQGQFHLDNKCGVGKLYLSNGEIIQGLFQNDSINGECRFFKRGGECLFGVWQQNKLLELYQNK